MANETDDELFGKHFELAGIKDDNDPIAEASKADDNNQAPVEKEEAVGGSIDELNGEKKPAAEDKSKQAPVEGEQQADANKDKQSGKVDGKPEQGKEKEGQDVVSPGDLKLADGTIVKSGQQRRWYEDAQISKREVIGVRNELNTVTQKYKALEEKNAAYEEAAKQLGVADPIDAAKALRLYKDLRTDPVATAKQLLVDLKAAGYAVDAGGAGVDTQAILAAIDQKIGGAKPSVETEQVDTVASEVQTFYSTFPDARLHDAYLAAVIEAHPEATLVDAYRELKQSAIANGYDWSKPLQPQIDAFIASKNETKVEPDPNKGPAPLNGKHLEGAQGFDPAKSVTQAEDYGDAIRASLKEAGYNVAN